MIVRPLGRISEFVNPRASVLASGAFDPLHYGHVRYLRSAAEHARARGLPLVVAVAPDEFVARRHPLLQTIEERMEMIDALRWVDIVVPQEDEDIVKAMHQIKPLDVVKGTDWRERGLPQTELDALEQVGAGTVWVEISPVSSSDLLRNAFWQFADEWVGRT